MDPNNTSPTQPAATPGMPAMGPADNAVANQAPVAPAANQAPASPIPSPASPVAAEPTTPVNVAPTPTAPVAPVNADVANAALNPPVNPVVAPGATPAAAPMAGGTMSMNQMFQTQPGGSAGVIDETTAIAVPEGPKPPDPVEEELKAPLKAAQPVPGSIGSAVSVPPAGGQPQNVAFNDPANAATNNPMAAAQPNAPAAKKPGFLDKMMAKTKMSKNTLILLAVVAGLVVVVLIAVLVMVATGVL